MDNINSTTMFYNGEKWHWIFTGTYIILILGSHFLQDSSGSRTCHDDQIWKSQTFNTDWWSHLDK